MATARMSANPRTRWGWRILMLVGALMLLDGAWLFVAGGSGDVFAADTGVGMAEVQEAYPSVVDVMNRRGRLLGLLVAGLGLVTVVASSGRRTSDARNAVGAVGVTSLAVATYVLSAGNVEVGVVYLVFGALAVGGVALVGSATRP